MEDADSAYNKSRDDLAVAHRDLRVAQSKIAALKKENADLLESLGTSVIRINTLVDEQETQRRDLRDTRHRLHQAYLKHPELEGTLTGVMGDKETDMEGIVGRKRSELIKENTRLRLLLAQERTKTGELRKALVGEMANLDRAAYTPTATPSKDPELAAIEQVLGILSRIEAEMGNAVSKRVLQYINNRHGY